MFQKWQEFGKFLSEHWKVSKICTLTAPFHAKYIIFHLKGTEELSFMTLKSYAKFKEKLICGLENDMRNLANFYQSNQNSQNLDFDGNLLSKAENVWA